MFSKIARFIKYRLPYYQKQLQGIHELKMLQARQMAWQVAQMQPKTLHETEFSVYSQWGDDGIIQYLVSKLPIENKVFVEFGVENYLEANTRFLLMNNNWSGLIMDGGQQNIDFVQHDKFYWQYDLKARKAFITAENINSLFAEHGIKGNIGLLHIDIDGNDYWVWKAIEQVTADIVIVEYNAVFGADKAWTVPYKADFVRGNEHYSNLYFGTSLKAICILAKERDMAFVGCNSAGNNAYFVKRSLLDHISLPELSCEQGFMDAKFRESRDPQGNLTYLGGTDRLKEIKGLQVWNVEEQKMETI